MLAKPVGFMNIFYFKPVLNIWRAIVLFARNLRECRSKYPTYKIFLFNNVYTTVMQVTSV
jgi:hypothetical protein